MSRRQRGKDHKRSRSWHRGRSEFIRWRSVQLPDVRSGADPTAGAPRPLRRNGTTPPGDAL